MHIMYWAVVIIISTFMSSIFWGCSGSNPPTAGLAQVSSPTAMPTSIPEPTRTSTPELTATPRPTNTPIPPTSTSFPPTATPSFEPTATPISTETPVPPSTPTPVPTVVIQSVKDEVCVEVRHFVTSLAPQLDAIVNYVQAFFSVVERYSEDPRISEIDFLYDTDTLIFDLDNAAQVMSEFDPPPRMPDTHQDFLTAAEVLLDASDLMVRGITGGDRDIVDRSVEQITLANDQIDNADSTLRLLLANCR